MDRFLREKSTWILRGKDYNINSSDSFVFQNIDSIEGVYLPDTCKLITYGNDCVCFVSYNELNTINYQQFWFDEKHKEISFIHTNAKINFTGQKWPMLKIDKDIIDIKATQRGLFALAVSDNNKFLLYKWKSEPDGFENEYSVVKMDVPNFNRQESNPKILVATSGVHNIVLIYNIPQGVFIGRYIDGQKNVELEEIKFFPSTDNAIKYKFTLIEKEVSDKATHLEYWGVDTETYKLFKYKYSLTKTEKSKLYYLKARTLDENFFSSEITDMRIANILVHCNDRKDKYEYSKFLFLSTNNPKCIYMVHHSLNDTYTISPLIYNSNEKSLFKPFKEMAFDVDLGYLDSLCIINNQLLIFGNSNEEGWKFYKFPFFVRNPDVVKNTINYHFEDTTES